MDDATTPFVSSKKATKLMLGFERMIQPRKQEQPQLGIKCLHISRGVARVIDIEYKWVLV
jgi:hypothetical protein